MPDARDIDASFQGAFAHHRAGRLAEAEPLYREVLTIAPTHADARRLLGALLTQTGQHAEAVDELNRAIAAAPDDAEAHYNLAAALTAAGHRDAAVAALDRAIASRPAFADAHNNRGALLRELGRVDEAIAAGEAALAIRPAYPEALVNLGLALHAARRADEALAAAWRAVAAAPGHADAHHLLALVSAESGQPDAALVACRDALALRPASADVLALLGHVLKEVGRVDESIAASRRALALRPHDEAAWSNLLFTLHLDPASTPASLLAAHGEWGRRFPSVAATPARDRDPDRRLRVGFVSPDFRRHPVGRFVLPLFRHLDRSRVEVFAYDNAARADDATVAIRAAVDAWRPIRALDDDAAASLVRDDRIDVLVDVAMHGAGNRLLLFARRPAPVQATWLAYASTAGLDAIDFRIGDPHFDPPGTDGDYVERTVRLPRTYWCYPAPAEAGDVAPLPASRAGHVTFGSLNGFAKASAPALAAWARVLAAVPGSRLLLHAPEGSARRRVRDAMARAGVDAGRVAFVARASTADYFRRYDAVDVALDPFPFAGGTTTCDALWMGVPVVTLAGATGVGRAGASVLANVGLADWIAADVDAYVRVAAERAADLSALAVLRAGMRERMLASPLMDAPAFAREFEAALRTMWRASLAGVAP